MVVNEGARLEGLVRKVNDITGGGMSERKMWYSLKYDREMLVEVEGDNDVKMIFKGNDEHAYLYIGGKEGPVRRAQVTVCVSGGGGRCGGSGRVCGGAGIGRVCGKRLVDIDSFHSEDQRPESRLRCGGEVIEMSDDDEIFIASDDGGEDEATAKDDAGEQETGGNMGKKGKRGKRAVMAMT